MGKKLQIILTVLLAGIVVVSAGTGAMHIAPHQVIAILLKKTGISVPVSYDASMEGVLWMIRLPRVLLGVVVGAGLAVAGAALQGLFRNPMADPGLIGISSGATLAAVLMIVFQSILPAGFNSGWGHYYGLSLTAFAGAFMAALFIIRISSTGGESSVAMMLLGGIAVNALCMAITWLLTYLSTNEQLRSIVFWTMGSLGGATWTTLLTVLPFILLPVMWLPRLATALDVFALGEREAMHSGVQVQALKLQLLLLATLAIAAGVAVTGTISFVGLVVPHIIRQFTGPSYRWLFPCAALAGAILLTLADLFCRTIIAPAELPVGVVTAIIGAPFFIWLIIKEKRKLIS